MVTMSQTWSIFTVVTLLALQLCIGEKSCTIRSSAGSVVQRGSSFKVYCTFKCKCRGSMDVYPPIPQKHIDVNFTDIYFSVVNITENRTFSCHCTCDSHLDPCGMDISAGYPPDSPKNISCIYKVNSSESGVVHCTWKRGRDTHLRNSSTVLWVRTGSGNHTAGPVTYNVATKGNDTQAANFTVSSSAQQISVWIQEGNELGSAVSTVHNYTLSDIAMPATPDLGQPECSSRECLIHVKQFVPTQHLEIEYCTDAKTWRAHPDTSSAPVRSISSLEPYTLYHFRAKSKFGTGLWSEPSANVTRQTEEEAPAKELDVWYAEPASDSKSLKVYWKEPNISISRGKITEYKVEVCSQNSGPVFNDSVSADTRNYTVPFCASCEVVVWARNSKGLSPPAKITTQHTKAKPFKVTHKTVSNHSVTISWRKPETAPTPAAHVVEWYPGGHKLEELRWVRLSRDDNQAVLTGLKPFECYEGSLYVVHDDNSVSRSRFTDVATFESAPTAGPYVEESVEGNKVIVKWRKISRGERGGCITNYTIYLENGSGDWRAYSVPVSAETHVITDLSPTVYRLWMTASTAGGEGSAGQVVKFYIQQDTQLSLLLVCAVAVAIVLFLMCLCQTSAVKQRLWVCLQCLMLDDVPDPANSKWAKECTQEKGKIKLQLQPSNSTVNEEEEEPILVDVEELPKQGSDVRTQTPAPQTSLSPLTEPASLLYPLTTYLKSLSHDSDTSDHTQTSLETNTTVDYISSHGPEHMYEEDQDEQEEEEEEEEDDEVQFADMLGFFPSHNIAIAPLEFGGKLTLDAVKIGGSDFFQNNF